MNKLIYIWFVLLISNSAFSQLGTQDYQVLKESVLNNDKVKIKSESRLIKKKLSTSILNYYRILLNQTPKNSVLIVNAYNDYFSLLCIQQTEKVRGNVLIVSLELLNNDKYLNLIFNLLNISKDFDKRSKSIYLNRILEKSSRIVTLSTTVNSINYPKYLNDFYNIGLILVQNGNNQYNKLNQFYLKLQKFKFKNLNEYERKISSNYLPPLLILYKIKLKLGVKDEKLKKLINEISETIGNKKTVDQIIINYEKDSK